MSVISFSYCLFLLFFFFFFFNDTATTEIYTLSLHDALPISHIGPELNFVSLCDPRETDHAFSAYGCGLNDAASFWSGEQGDDPACDKPGVIECGDDIVERTTRFQSDFFKARPQAVADGERKGN